jgi:hypothetical protein
MAQSHFPPGPDLNQQGPSDLWGVGYRLLAEHEEVARTA